MASSHKGFHEEQASVMLAWLLNPQMEHGLGFTFLNKFLQKIDASGKTFNQISTVLQPILRSERSSDKLKFSCDIEFSVDNSRIDIVLFINDYVISIENKIYSEAASNHQQLTEQYTGLKNKFKDEYKIFVVFLVPNKEHYLIKSEYDNLNTNAPDEKIIIDWDLVREIIQEIIDEDQKCLISPINDYLRHTLKAFSSFIADNFEGYYVETSKNYGEMNPLAKGRKKLEEIRLDNTITFVGVRYGIYGLLDHEKEDLKSRSFQYTTENMNNHRWLKRDLFIKISDYIINENFDTLDWIEDIPTAAPSVIIYKLAQKTKKEFFIGIRGGESALTEMNKETIFDKTWSISINKRTDEWITNDKFLEIVKSKNVFD
ncbi:hypothetical protein FACS1894102_4250 [Spirochaetia bacterium]|nr:hypothetical protein FACS1894102_4250 [Spirochaetia bacterium]